MHPFSTPWKHQKSLRFFGCFKEVEKGCIGNEWVKSGLLVDMDVQVPRKLPWSVEQDPDTMAKGIC